MTPKNALEPAPEVLWLPSFGMNLLYGCRD